MYCENVGLQGYSTSFVLSEALLLLLVATTSRQWYFDKIKSVSAQIKPESCLQRLFGDCDACLSAFLPGLSRFLCWLVLTGWVSDYAKSEQISVTTCKSLMCRSVT